MIFHNAHYQMFGLFHDKIGDELLIFDFQNFEVQTSLNTITLLTLERMS